MVRPDFSNTGYANAPAGDNLTFVGEGDGGPMVVDHNTLTSLGNTNGLALQENDALRCEILQY
jgi:hypothetical protein